MDIRFPENVFYMNSIYLICTTDEVRFHMKYIFIFIDKSDLE